MELLEAALAYAERGWAIFPIVPGRKKPPLVDKQYERSSSDPEQIRAWWRASPNANIGLDCHKSGVAVIDVDTAEGHKSDGTKALEKLQLLTGVDAWDTLVSKTTTGGTHYIFEAPPKDGDAYLKTDGATFGLPGVDTRGRGGYIVLPPSRIGGKEYEWQNDKPTKPIPGKFLTKKRGKDELGRTEVEGILHDQTFIPQGKRDATLIKIGGKLSFLGFSREEIAATLRSVYENRSEPGSDPMTDADFERLAKSASGYERPTNQVLDIITSSGTVIEAQGFFNNNDGTFAVPASTFLSQYEESVSWVVDQLLQTSSVNMLQGPPKSGKSTLLRNLAYSVAFGLPFLGTFKTEKQRVLYYTLQENKAHLLEYSKTLFKSLGLDESEIPVDFVFRLPTPGLKAVRGLRERIVDKGYGFIAIDMFLRFAGIEELNNYVEVDAATAAINELAQDLNVCVLWTHHSKKDDGGKDAFAGGIGSQALRGSVYTTIKTWKEKGRRMIESEQRHGQDLTASAVSLDKKTMDMRIVGSGVALAIGDAEDRETKLDQLFKANPSISARDAQTKVGGRYREIEAALERRRRKAV